MHKRKGKYTVRTATADDAGTLCAWWNDGRVMEHAGFPYGLSTTEAEVNAIIAQNCGSRQLMIVEVDRIAVGEMNYRRIDGDGVEIGIKICRSDFQGQGHGPIVLTMLIEHLFRELDFNRIVLDTNVNNTRAQHVYEKLGFREVERRIDSWVDQMGRTQSAVVYELRRGDGPVDR